MLSIVIVNYHACELVNRCLESLRKHCRADIPIDVIDNSVPSEYEAIVGPPGVQVHAMGRNLGFAAACNVGIQHSIARGCDYVLLLNPDTRTESDFISPLLAAMEKDPTVGMIGPRIMKDDGSGELWFSPGRINWWRGRITHDQAIPDSAGGLRGAEFLTGCAMLLRIEAVRQVGLMDERYFLYFEDTDYSMAFRQAGWRLVFHTEAQLLHAASSTIGYLSETYLYYFSRNQVLFMRRWAGRLHFRFFQVWTVAVMLPAAVAYFGAYRRSPGRMRAYITGAVSGLRGLTGPAAV